MTKRRERGPYKLTKEVEETILRHLKTGAFQKHACEAAGIEYRTMKGWLDRADEGEQRYLKFAINVRKVQAEDAIRSQSIITRAQLGRIDGDWKAAAWALERKYPKEYGQAQAGASVTLRGNAAGGGTDDESTTVQFYLPDNGRRPQDDDPGDSQG